MKYEAEVLGEEDDDGTMPQNVSTLSGAVIGHRIVSVERDVQLPEGLDPWNGPTGTAITLDSGKRVFLLDTEDCCAYTQLEAFLLHPELVDHMIMGVGTTGGYTHWHIYADMGDVLELAVGWTCGNPFYYAYGFDIQVIDS